MSKPIMLTGLQGFVTSVELHAEQILNDQTIKQFRDELLALVDEGHRKLVIDFHRVRYLSSAAIGKLITLRFELLARQGKLALCDLEPEILEAFKITDFISLFVIKDTLDEAVQCVAA